jgi:16S rRNA (guanine(966)-N(2))-methyltransferase RsmD
MTKQNRKSARKNSGQKGNKAGKPPVETVGLRIIGGRFRRRKLLYSGELRTRPMKDRLREAVFNLIGGEIEGAHAIDLFAGTGALGLEALSRGAARATLIEQHFPTADIIRQNVLALGVQSQTEIVPGNVFIWIKRRPDLGKASWLVFCSPPYDFYVSRSGEMLELLGGLIQAAPVKSIFVVEADERFDYALLRDPKVWDVRSYPPAVIGVYRK